MAFYSVALQYIDNPIGALLFIGLIPFLLLYLIKSKPRDRVVPSLMFLIKQLQKQKTTSFFEKFLRDLLVVFHFLILVTMCIAAMHPYYEGSANVAAEYTVLVLDNSASMGTKDGISSRFNKVGSEAKKHLSGKVSIILAQNTPYIVLREGDKDEALDVINSIPKSSSLSALGASILAADDLFGDNKGKVVVISDFIYTDPVSPHIARETLEAKGHTVEFVNIRNEGKNVGIVEMSSDKDQTQVTVQNYNEKTEYVTVNANDQKYDLEIAPYWNEKVTFTHHEGINTIELKQGDDFAADNEVLLSVPMREERDILVVTNEEKSHIYPVILAYADEWNDEVTVEKGEPPVMPVVTHDIVIVSEVDTGNFPGAVSRKIEKAVKEGATLVVTAQEDIGKLGFNDILPVDIPSNPVVEQKVDVFMENVLTVVTDGISVPSQEKYLQATPKEGAIVFASTSEGTPMMAMTSYGEGTVFYYGVLDSNSTFKYDIAYPLFWLQLIDYAIGKESVDTLNYKVGEKVLFDNEIEITMPSGLKKKQDYIDFDEVGIYEFKNKRVTANLLNNVESNIAYVDEALEKTVAEQAEEEETKAKNPLAKKIIIGLLVALFLELIYVKSRGDF